MSNTPPFAAQPAPTGGDDIFGSLPPVLAPPNSNPFDTPAPSAAAAAPAPAASTASALTSDPFDVIPERASAGTILGHGASARNPSVSANVNDPYLMGFSQPTHTPASTPAAEPAPIAAAATVTPALNPVPETAVAKPASQPQQPPLPAVPTANAAAAAKRPSVNATPNSISAASAYAAAAGVAVPPAAAAKPSAAAIAAADADDDEDPSSRRQPLFSFKNLDKDVADLKSAASAAVAGVKSVVTAALSGDAKTKGVYESIKVGEPELRGSNALTNYHVYKVVTVPNPGVDAVWRRYSDFDWLRASLVKWFPGLFVPPLPPKKAFGSTDAEFVKERKMDIERFLWRCAQVPALALSDPFTAFVSKADGFDEAKKVIDKQVDTRGAEEMIRAYKQLFPHQMGFALGSASSVDSELGGLLEWLTAAEAKMQTLMEASVHFDQTYQQHVKHLSTLTTLLTGVDVIEKGFKLRPEPARLDVLENFNHWIESSKQLAPAYNRDLVTTFKHELQDIGVFIDLLKHRADVAKAYNKAVATAAKWKKPDAPATATEKLQKQKDSELKNEENLGHQLDAMSKLILSEQIKKFWLEKTIQFRRAMASLAKTHSVVHHHMTQTFETLYEEANTPL